MQAGPQNLGEFAKALHDVCMLFWNNLQAKVAWRSDRSEIVKASAGWIIASIGLVGGADVAGLEQM